MKIDFVDFLLLSFGGFSASFINSIVGGGGLISLPILLFLGIPAHSVLGTNKFAATSGATTSSYYFIRKGKINFSILKWLAPFTLLGAYTGVNTVMILDEKYLYYIMPIIIIFIAIYTLFSKKTGTKNNFKSVNKSNTSLGIIMAFSIGFYDGFFGPGTGIFLIFTFVKIFKLDFVLASGNAKFLNFISNIVSLFLFAINGKVLYSYGIVMGIFMVIGGIFGSKVSINKGVKFIKPLFIIIAIISALGIIYNKILN